METKASLSEALYQFASKVKAVVLTLELNTSDLSSFHAAIQTLNTIKEEVTQLLPIAQRLRPEIYQDLLGLVTSSDELSINFFSAHVTLFYFLYLAGEESQDESQLGFLQNEALPAMHRLLNLLGNALFVLTRETQ